MASLLYVGKRRVVDRGPHNIHLLALGKGCRGSDGIALMRAAVPADVFKLCRVKQE